MEPHILLQMPLFRGITEETLLKFVLLHQHTLKSYKSGEFIAMQGDIYRSLYILCNGTVRTQMVSAEGKQLTIETLRAPKLLACNLCAISCFYQTAHKISLIHLTNR